MPFTSKTQLEDSDEAELESKPWMVQFYKSKDVTEEILKDQKYASLPLNDIKQDTNI